jgi:hypothetical protein
LCSHPLDDSQDDLQKVLPPGVPGMRQLFGGEHPGPFTVGEVYNRLNEVYGAQSSIGWDFMHIQVNMLVFSVS